MPFFVLVSGTLFFGSERAGPIPSRRSRFCFLALLLVSPSGPSFPHLLPLQPGSRDRPPRAGLWKGQEVAEYLGRKSLFLDGEGDFEDLNA